MIAQTLDQQFANLIARARVSPYFDFERALCLAMESHMQQVLAVASTLPPPDHRGSMRGTFSVVNIFAWPSEELCACLHKSETDHLYIFDTNKRDLSKIDSTEPMLYPIEQGNRIVILNDFAGRYLDQNSLENLLVQNNKYSKELLEQELILQAQVRARGKEQSGRENFVVEVFEV